MQASWKVVVPLLALFSAVASFKAIIGGPTDADLNEQEVKDALQFAVDEIISTRNTTFLRKMTSAGKAQKQVVVGMMYIVQADMATTNCAKGQEETHCAIHEDSAIAFREKCTSYVWKHPWVGKYEVLQLQCVA